MADPQPVAQDAPVPFYKTVKRVSIIYIDGPIILH